MFRNGSGYADPTAYKAMKRMEDAMNQTDWMEGDIVETVTLGGETMMLLLLKCHDDYATVFRLVDNEPHQNAYRIVAKEQMWLDLGRPMYVFYSRIIEFVKSVGEDELQKIKGAVAKAFGLTIEIERETESEPEIPDPGPQAVEIDTGDMANKIVERIAELLTTYTVEQTKFTRMSIERDIFKELYEKEVRGGNE